MPVEGAAVVLLDALVDPDGPSGGFFGMTGLVPLIVGDLTAAATSTNTGGL